ERDDPAEVNMSDKRRILPARRTYLRRPARALRARLQVELLEDRTTPSVSFLAVGAGDASSNDAILWTRAQDSATPGAGVSLSGQVTTDPAFGSFVMYGGTTDPAHDYTIHIDATSLQSNTTYYYRFAAGATLSPVGTFKTAPPASANVAIHAGFTGDADGLM